MRESDAGIQPGSRCDLYEEMQIAGGNSCPTRNNRVAGLRLGGDLATTPPFPMTTIGVAIIGCGGITLQNHLPSLALCADTRAVALCDSDAATLEKASRDTGIGVTSTNYEEIVRRDDVHAVIIATP